MTDINQWRRMIQPARVRSPALDVEEPESITSPTTPRKGLKPKLSSYFNQFASDVGPSKTDLSVDEDLLGPKWSAWTDDPPQPDAERLIESIMGRLLADPGVRLDSRFNSILLQIFECYRELSEENQGLVSALQQANERYAGAETAMAHQIKKWSKERQKYKDEVKRLELLLAKGGRGLAEVTLARQDSLLRKHGHVESPEEDDDDKTLETIFEFLEKTKRYEDQMWSSQRATMRRRSPSARMRRLSKQLTTKASTNVYADLPFGTPPTTTTPNILKVSDPGIDYLHRTASNPKNSISDDTMDTFSCEGDLLPDETADVNLIEVAGTDNDFIAIKRIAHVLAKRRRIDVEEIMPKLRELFAAQPAESDLKVSKAVPPHGFARKALDRSCSVESTPRGVMSSKLTTKATSFFAKKKPRINIDTSFATGRRFSFEPGDDTVASFSASPMDTLPAAVRDRLLRKSASMSVLSNKNDTAESMIDTSLSPVQQSPTTSATQSESKKASSRIPTPVYNSGSLARPRRDRDDSASSLLTAIKHSEDDASQGNDGSMSSSAYSSPSANHNNSTQAERGSYATQTNGSFSNRLLSHTNTLRGSRPLQVATHPSAYADQEASANRDKRPGVRSVPSSPSSQSRISDMSELRKENIRRMRWPAKVDDDESNATS